MKLIKFLCGRVRDIILLAASGLYLLWCIKPEWHTAVVDAVTNWINNFIH